LITGLSTTNANHIAFVHDTTANTIKGYLNGVLNVTVASGSVNLTGSSFFVGSQNNFSIFGLRNDAWMDEFQMYSRALSAADVTDAMNANFVSAVPEPASMTIMGCCMAGLLAVRMRKKRNNAAA
jgi:hypothetical protein